MRIWPAVDLLDGRCVRLYKGRYDRVTEYDRDPVAVAERFAADGARALHVVDLDGAREGRPVNAGVVLEIRRRVDLPLQVGGGVRDDDDVARYLDAGVDRVVLGTGAVRRPDWLSRLVARHGPAAVAGGVDVRDGEVVVEGWREGSGVGRDDLLGALADAGVETVVYTDTVRDGTLTRPDVEGARRVVRAGFRTLVAGGISRPEDIAALREAGAAGAVVGSALYTGALTLEAATAAARGDGPAGAAP
jgi:phosphoribosylformimino-5-aminoimidazole carboxamide ribotide isomerase